MKDVRYDYYEYGDDLLARRIAGASEFSLFDVWKIDHWEKSSDMARFASTAVRIRDVDDYLKANPRFLAAV